MANVVPPTLNSFMMTSPVEVIAQIKDNKILMSLLEGIDYSAITFSAEYFGESNDPTEDETIDLSNNPVLSVINKEFSSDYQFEIDWENEWVRCPQGHYSRSWYERQDKRGQYFQVRFSAKHCKPCKTRSQCTRSKQKIRTLKLQPRPLFEALKEARSFHESEEGKTLYRKRAGVEGTISQGVRAFGLRRARYRGLAKLRD